MDNWTRPAKVTYMRWRNAELGNEADFVGPTDEDQGTDNEICTIASAKVDPVGTQSANSSEANTSGETFSVDDALEAIGFGIFHWKISVLTGLSWIGDAMEMMILSILGPQLHCEWRLPSYEVALITSVVFIGMGLSSPVWGNVSDKYGRRLGLTICMGWTLFYGLLSAFAPVYGWLLFLRGLVGFGIGGAPQSVTLYSEFLPVKSRGICIMLIAAFWAIGAVFEVLLALWIMPTLGWRWLLGLSTLPVAIFVCFCFWLPESPRFDVLTGRREKAMATLARIAKENGKAMPQGTLIDYKQTERGRIKDLFSPQYRRTTLLLWFICFLCTVHEGQQKTGEHTKDLKIWNKMKATADAPIYVLSTTLTCQFPNQLFCYLIERFANAFSYFGIVLLTTELFQAGDSCGVTQGGNIEPRCSLECKYLTSNDYKDLLWTTLAEFPGLLVILLAIDYIGRKKSMALCFFMFSLCILPLFACIGRIALTIFIFISRAFISGGYQVVFVYTPEVFPTEIRALAMGTSSAVARVGALITPFVAQVMLRTSVYLTLSVYCGCCLLAGVASLILPVETLGRSLQETSLEQKAGGQTTTTSQTYGSTHSAEQP